MAEELGALLRSVVAGPPPVTVDPRAVRRQARRRRGVAAGAVAVLASVAVASAAVVAVGGADVSRDRSAPADVRVDGTWTTATWGSLTWRVPPGWLVSAPPADHSYPFGASVDGPSISTVPTGDMCAAGDGTPGCARPNAMTTIPSEGVIAWITSARRASALPDAVPADPGTLSAAPCMKWPDARPFHAVRLFGTAANGSRVAVEGCVFGTRAAERARELAAVAATVSISRYPG